MVSRRRGTAACARSRSALFEVDHGAREQELIVEDRGEHRTRLRVVARVLGHHLGGLAQEQPPLLDVPLEDQSLDPIAQITLDVLGRSAARGCQSGQQSGHECLDLRRQEEPGVRMV